MEELVQPELSAEPKATGIVPDTNILYGSADALKDLEQQLGVNVRPSLNSALEILCAEKEKDLAKRQSAARCWLVFRDNAIVDSEVFHAELLGYRLANHGLDEWSLALERFVDLKDLSQEQFTRVGLNLQSAIEAKKRSSEHFVKKTDQVWRVYREQVRQAGEKLDAKIPHVISHCPEVIGQIVAQFEMDVVHAKVEQLEDLARDLEMTGERVANPAFPVYSRLYLKAMERATAFGRAQVNDYLDLQFFAYCDGGLLFVTREKKWIEVAREV